MIDLKYFANSQAKRFYLEKILGQIKGGINRIVVNARCIGKKIFVVFSSYLTKPSDGILLELSDLSKA